MGRLVALPARAMDLLWAVRATRAAENPAIGRHAPDHVFAHRYRGAWSPWPPESAHEDMRRIHGVGGLPLPAQSMHQLRHTQLTMVAAAGMPLRDAQMRAGHGKPGITLAVHTHAAVEGQRARAEAAAEPLMPDPPAKASERSV